MDSMISFTEAVIRTERLLQPGALSLTEVEVTIEDVLREGGRAPSRLNVLRVKLMGMFLDFKHGTHGRAIGIGGDKGWAGVEPSIVMVRRDVPGEPTRLGGRGPRALPAPR